MNPTPHFTSNAPRPAGHYSQSIEFNGLLFVSGQLPIDPLSDDRSVGPIEDQARQVLKNLRSIVDDAGSSMDGILKVTIYISDMTLWGAVNAIYTEYFGDHKPARAIVPVNELHYGYQIELEAIAAVNR